jgi:hypothetical protein
MGLSSVVVAQASEGRASFCEQKEAKKLCYAGSWVMSATTPIAQHKRSFCAAFQKAAAFFHPKPRPKA